MKSAGFDPQPLFAACVLPVSFLAWNALRLCFPQLGLEVHPLFAYIFGIIEMRADSSEVKKQGIRRLLSNCIGFFTAAGALLLLDRSALPPWGELALLMVCVAGLLYCNNRAGLPAGVGVTVFLVCVLMHRDGQLYGYIASRFLKTLLGIACAYAISRVAGLLRPKKSSS